MTYYGVGSLENIFDLCLGTGIVTYYELIRIVIRKAHDTFEVVFELGVKFVLLFFVLSHSILRFLFG